jgi:hypothetical protein
MLRLHVTWGRSKNPKETISFSHQNGEFPADFLPGKKNWDKHDKNEAQTVEIYNKIGVI